MKFRGMIGFFYFVLSFQFSFAESTQSSLDQLQSLAVRKVGILLASAKGVGQSSFGHSYIRLSSHDFFTDEDLTIEFVADDRGKEISIIKGLGFGENYKFNVVAEKYRNVKYLHNILEGRDLATYPLIMSNKQLSEVAKLIYASSDKIKKLEYSFFVNNCSSLVESALDEIFGLNGSIFPDVPALLKNKYSKFIKKDEITIDEGAPEQRKRLVETKLPKIFIESRHVIFQNSLSHLNSLSETVRIKEFIKLLMAQEFISLSKEDLRRLKIFFNLYSLLEKKSTLTEMLALAGLPMDIRKERINITPLLNESTAKELEIDSADKIQFSYSENPLKIENKKPIFEFSYKIPVVDFIDQGRTFSVSKKIDLMPFGYKRAGANVTFNGENILFSLNDKIFGKNLISLNTLTSFEIVEVEGKKYISPIIFSEFAGTQSHDADKNFEFNIDNLISIPNFNYKGIGNCMSLVLTQKALIEQTVFLPEEPALSLEQNKELLKRAIEGKMILVPGFQGIYDWTQSIGKEALEEIIGNYGLNLNLYGFGSLIAKYFTRKKLNEEILEDMKVVLNNGVPVPVRFKVEGKKIEHALLVYDVKEEKDRYLLRVYDPNTGLVDFNLKNNESVHTILKSNGLYYSALYAKSGTRIYIDVMDVERSLFMKLNRNQVDFKKVYSKAKYLNKFDFDRF